MKDNPVLKTIAGVWENYTDEEYRRDQSHWRGYGRWKDDEKWQRIGQTSLEKLNTLMTHIGAQPGIWTKPRTFLEWGPGGGANLFAHMRYAHRYYGVDISQKNLSECSRLAKAEHFDGFREALLDGDPMSIVDKIDEPVDTFLSSAVFQHFPSKDYGAEVLQAIHAVTAPRAIGHIQIRYDDGKEKYRPIESLEDYEERHITATSFPIHEFHDLCEDVGFKVLYMSSIVTRTNYLTFNLIKKTASK
ncbi:class I SAM-dependent methyltransferase [Parasphingopyxis algicola]|uniref:class I SAM-dependent methyltransferase n=1 Tax=Parasphingopyxis algicola TaxID=2026624 RepID=UPI0015A0FD61|nr:class I SAM-dependent methyltransferase [Parasphingopyxis algicola]QLC26653.1 class I SAM-dependent methyltransferase [Parasphingopyxis algicola]